MLFIGNVLTGLTVGTGGRVGRVMSGRILDGGSRKRPFTDVRARRSGIRRCGLRAWPHDGALGIASLRLSSIQDRSSSGRAGGARTG